jgi:hypothetical protein
MARRKNPAAVALGRRGGKAAAGRGGQARWAGVSAEERKRQMRDVVRARWAKKKKKKKRST